jgi:TolB-like protein
MRIKMERPFTAYSGEDPYIFVSYSHADAALVYPELKWLHDQGFNIWYDEGISPGSTWRDEVALALTQCRLFLYFVSPRSVASSNCLKEVNFCLSRERKMLCVHLEKTDLPVGLELSLSDMQAIMCTDHSPDAYRKKLEDSLGSLLPRQLQPVDLTFASDDSKSPTDEKSIAVLPLVNRNLDAENEYLSDGIAEELINGLSRLKDLRVASQMSSFRFKNQDADMQVVGEKLSVQNILSGSIQKAGNRIRVNIRLDRVSDGSMLWSQKYDNNLEDIFELQDDIARQVIEALEVELASSSQRVDLIDAGTRNIEAYNAFLLGMHEFNKLTIESLNQAAEQFTTAATIDTNFGRASWFKYICFDILLNAFGGALDEFQPKMRAAIQKVESTDFTMPVPKVVIGRWLEFGLQSDHRLLANEAVEKFQHSDPEWRDHEYWQMAQCLRSAGLLNAALNYEDRYFDSTTSNLQDLNTEARYVYLLTALGQFDRAINMWTERIAAYPDEPLSIGERALLYSRTGQYEKAERDLADIVKVFPRNFAQFYHLYWRREIDAAKAYYSWLEKRKNLMPIFKYWGAFLLGDLDKGIQYLNQLYDRNGVLFDVHVALRRVIPYSTYQEILQKPGFQELLAKDGADSHWQAELIDLANGVSDITGIHVQVDENY